MKVFPLKSMEFTDKELAHLLIPLRKYEEKPLADEAEDMEDMEDMEDTVTDLLSAQSLISELKAAKSR